jgi:hypothetical protein
MGTVYQLTAFLVLSLLAIDVTVYVLGVSLLGRAMRRASEEKQKAEEEKRKGISTELAAVRQKVEECITNSKKVAELSPSVKNLEGKLRNHDKRIKRISESASLLTVKGGVVYPGVLLLAALVLTLLASGSAESRWQVLCRLNIPVVLWLAAIALTSWAVVVILRVLDTIQGVAVTSDEAALKANVEALTLALQTHDDSKNPVLAIVLESPEPPVLIPVNAESTLAFAAMLTKGQVAKNTDVLFMSAPGQFTFPKLAMFKQSSTSPQRGYTSGNVSCGDIRGGQYRQIELVVKSPAIPGKYTLVYRLTCDGYTSAGKIELTVG